MSQRRSWRTALTDYLGTRAGTPVRIGDILAHFMPLVPLEAATRIWLLRHSDLVSPSWMRRACIVHALAGYRLVHAEKRIKGTSLSDDALVIPQTISCAHCGKPFFSYLQAKHCSNRCGCYTRWAAPRTKAKQGKKAKQDEHYDGRNRRARVQLELQRAQELRDVPAPVLQL